MKWRLVRSVGGSNGREGALLDPDTQRALLSCLRQMAANGSRPAPVDQSGGAALAEFVDDQLQVERDRRVQINTRGGGLITTSASLATLLFATSALVTGASGFRLPRLALWGLALAFVTFIAAAFCGIMAMRTIRFDVVTPKQLNSWRGDDNVWKNSQPNVLRLLTKANILSLASLRTGNSAKMQWVRVGFWTQIGALCALAVAVGAILIAAIFPQFAGWLDMFKHV